MPFARRLLPCRQGASNPKLRRMPNRYRVLVYPWPLIAGNRQPMTLPTFRRRPVGPKPAVQLFGAPDCVPPPAGLAGARIPTP